MDTSGFRPNVTGCGFESQLKESICLYSFSLTCLNLCASICERPKTAYWHFAQWQWVCLPLCPHPFIWQSCVGVYLSNPAALIESIFWCCLLCATTLLVSVQQQLHLRQWKWLLDFWASPVKGTARKKKLLNKCFF